MALYWTSYGPETLTFEAKGGDGGYWEHPREVYGRETGLETRAQGFIDPYTGEFNQGGWGLPVLKMREMAPVDCGTVLAWIGGPGARAWTMQSRRGNKKRLTKPRRMEWEELHTLIHFFGIYRVPFGEGPPGFGLVMSLPQGYLYVATQGDFPTCDNS